MGCHGGAVFERAPAVDRAQPLDLLGLSIRALFASLRRRARAQWGVSRGFCGAVTFVQRFGSALNLNLHFHSLTLDGVYEIRDWSVARFHPLPPPDDAEVARVASPRLKPRRMVPQDHLPRGTGRNSDLADAKKGP
jgi:hypothetical protein